jgi:endonuclease/exonuclease/phosphatase family metal-dependent hydrolase
MERPRTEVPAEFHPNTDFPRSALEIVIDFDGTALRVFSVHLSHLPGAQQESQVEALKQLVFSLPQEAPMWEDHPRISQFSQNQAAPSVPQSSLLLGDFNFEPDSALYTAMLDPLPGQTCGLVDGWTASGNDAAGEQTCVENDGRLSRLDYMFASNDLQANFFSASVNQNTEASDHFPVYFVVEI